MQEYYKTLRHLDMDSKHIAAAVTEGAFAGSRLLLAGGTILWESAVLDHTLQQPAQALPEYEALKKELAAQFWNLPGCGIYQSCTGSVYCEALGREKKLVICGGGHVSIPLIRICRMMGYPVTVLEDRPKFAGNAKQAGACEVYCEPFAEGLAKIQGDTDTFFVIVTRGHRYDQECLLQIARKKSACIGMIGSRRRAAAVKEAVIKQGADPAVIAKVYTPVGLAIGAKTPEEIAVAIAAQIIQVKNQKTGGSLPAQVAEAEDAKNADTGANLPVMQDTDTGANLPVIQDADTVPIPVNIIDAVLDEAYQGEPKVLATIIRRKGSAPQEAGAKMLVLSDGNCIGTIGGGCAESEIQKKALLMMREGKKKLELCCADLTGDAAEEEGMVCGGRIDVMLEWIE